MEIVTHVPRLFFFLLKTEVCRQIDMGWKPTGLSNSSATFVTVASEIPQIDLPLHFVLDRRRGEVGKSATRGAAKTNQDLQKQNVADWHRHYIQRNKNMHHCRIPGDLSSYPSHNSKIKWLFNVLLQSVTCSMCAFMFLSVSFFWTFHNKCD